MFCRGIKGEFDFLREEFENFVLICPKHTCSLPGGCPRSLVGILKCLVSAFCQGYTTLSEI